MKQFLMGCSVTVWFLAIAGCQCNGVAERYSDVIDDVADSGPRLDFLYTPCLDLSRIGMPDWCQCRFSGLICRRGCCNNGWSSAHYGPCPDCGQYHQATGWTTAPESADPPSTRENGTPPENLDPEAPPKPSPDPTAPPAPTSELSPPVFPASEPVLQLDR